MKMNDKKYGTLLPNGIKKKGALNHEQSTYC